MSFLLTKTLVRHSCKLSSYSYLHTCISKSQTKHYFDILCFVNIWNFPFFISSRVKYVDFFVHNKCIQFTFKNSKKKDLFHWWWQEKNDIIVTDLFNTYNLYHHFCVCIVYWCEQSQSTYLTGRKRICTSLTRLEGVRIYFLVLFSFCLQCWFSDEEPWETLAILFLEMFLV